LEAIFHLSSIALDIFPWLDYSSLPITNQINSMVLSDKEIYKYLSTGDLVFATRDRAFQFNLYEQVQPSSIDLRLDNKIIRFKKGTAEFDIKHLDNVREHIEEVNIAKGEQIRLEPNELIFCQTYEQLKMPSDCMGIVEGKSRFARLGLAVHSTGGYINPDFEGVMPLQIINHNKIPLIIYPYISVCQLILFKTDSIPLIPYPERTNNPYYKEQIASPSVLHKDKSISGGEDINLIQLERERRKIDTYIRKLDTFNTHSFSERSYGFNEQPKQDNKNISIHFTGGQQAIGNLNLGEIIGTVNSHLQDLNFKGQIELSKALKNITKEVADSNDIDEKKKIEYAEYLKLLSEEANKPVDKRNNAVVKTILSLLAKGLQVSANLSEVWGTFGTQVTDFFT
jgi:dCTP deaminase